MMKKIFNGCLFQCTTNGVKKKKKEYRSTTSDF